MKKEKVFTIFAGINGAGKSTFYHAQKNKKIYGVRLNPDEMVKKLGADSKDIKAYNKVREIIIDLQEKCLKKGVSFNRETVLCGKYILEDILKAKKLGYKVNLIYIGVEDLNDVKNRVKLRNLNGGHFVPEGYVDARYDNSINNLVRYSKFCDNVDIYDNTNKEFKHIASIHNNRITMLDTSTKWGNKVVKDIEKDINETNEFELYYGFNQ